MIEKHFVTFCSPGTFFSETTTKEIDSWDVVKAVEMAHGIVERYGATPYSFFFTTRRNDGELDSTQVAASCNYFLGGEILTLEDVEARNDPNDQILISNMRSNHIERVVQNTNSFRTSHPLNDSDVILPFAVNKTGEK